MLTFSGEGAEGVDRVVRGVDRTYGGSAETVLTADGAVLSVTAGGRTLTSTVGAFADVARLDRAVALKEFVERVRDTRPALPEAAAGLRRVETLPATVPRWACGRSRPARLPRPHGLRHDRHDDRGRAPGGAALVPGRGCQA